MSRTNGEAEGGASPAEQLSSTQLTALEALLTGASVTEAAERAGVDRTTVSRWKNRDPEFMAALNARKRDVWERARSRLLAAVDEAVDTLVERASEDPWVADRLLQRAGVFAESPSEFGPTDPDEIRVRSALEKHRQEGLLNALRDALGPNGELPGPVLGELIRVLEIRTVDADEARLLEGEGGEPGDG